MQLNRFLKIALVSTLAAATTTEAFAIDAAATTPVNVRTGPGTGYSVLDTLYRGETVNVTECRSTGWCMIYHDGPDGWVSSNYLSQIQQGGNANSWAGNPSSRSNNASSGSSGGDDIAAVAAFAAILGIGAIMIGSAMSQDDDDRSGNASGYGTCRSGLVWSARVQACVPPRHHHRRYP